MNKDLPDVQVELKKGRGTRDQIANVCWSIEKAREFQKNIYFCFIDYAKAFDCVSQQTVGNSWRDGTTSPPDLPPEKSVCGSKKQQLEPDIEQWSGSKLRKEYFKAVYCHLTYMTYMQNISWNMLGWIPAQAGIKIARRNISNLKYADDTTLMAESKEELNQRASWRWKRRVKKLA